jgi:murein DD-endopeptidase MepM/ murein hydrolase activator NlpD
MDLYIGPRRKRRGRGWLLIIVILLVAGLVAWQLGWLPEKVMSSLEQNVERVITPGTDRLETEQAAAANLQLARTPVMQLPTPKTLEQATPTPPSKAYTADLYEETTDDNEIPWANAGGRTKVEAYTVKEGDTLWSIAAQFELDIDTLRWSNPELERNPDVLSLGTELNILPVQGVYHVATAGDTIADIAARYGVAEVDITNYPPNALYQPFDLAPGQGVIVPFGRKELNVPQPSPAEDSPIAWPVSGPVTQSYHADHLAIDIGGPYGTTVYAADGGEVIYASWAETGYGYTLIIDHGDGLETWYSHLKGTLLQSGVVRRGDPIGEMGSTGRSSGPHVHFEVRVNGKQVDPREYLPDSPN